MPPQHWDHNRHYYAAFGGFIFKMYFVLNFVYCVSVYMQCPRKVKVSDSPGVGVTGSCQLPCVGSENRMWGLCKSGV